MFQDNATQAMGVVSFAATGTTVERCEFEALLAGLQAILDHNGWNLKDISLIEDLVRKPLSVCWFSDRESLVLAVAKDPSGKPYYRRRSTPDLWARFHFYEPLFRITPTFVSRENTTLQNMMDGLASESRQVYKDFMEIRKLG